MKIDKGSFINDFIDKNLRQYSIPVYQRNYEWSAEQCEKLFEDIIQAHKLDRYHFTGSVVYSLLKTENKIDYYIIIDGQQRLTTIYILLKALIDVAETDAEKDALLSLMFNQDKFKKYNIDDSSKLKLKPIKSDNQQLILLMENHIDKMDKSSGIYQNYALFCKLAKSALEEDHDLSIEKICDGIGHLTWMYGTESKMLISQKMQLYRFACTSCTNSAGESAQSQTIPFAAPASCNSLNSS